MDLVAFTKEIFTGQLEFLCDASNHNATDSSAERALHKCLVSGMKMKKKLF